MSEQLHPRPSRVPQDAFGQPLGVGAVVVYASASTRLWKARVARYAEFGGIVITEDVNTPGGDARRHLPSRLAVIGE